MMYLFSKLFFWLIIAFLFGVAMGWILRNMKMRSEGQL